jgi:hypothetical protein
MALNNMIGSESQVEWAERIKASVQTEFDRVANAFRIAAERQQGQDQLDTFAILAILEDKRVEVMANQQAGYFVRVWRELSDQVRHMLAKDARFQAIQAERSTRKARKSNGI